ncbi:MAG TPA: hypothetical protein VGE69_02695 [Pseudomonadales bacterium]
MLSIFFAVAMAGIAQRDKRRPWLWGPLTFMLSALIQMTLVQGYWGAVLGLLGSFALMTWANIRYPVKRGPTLR